LFLAVGDTLWAYYLFIVYIEYNYIYIYLIN
jgi:hypothetical protein